MPKLRILVVDDAVVVRRILTDALSSDEEFEIFTAANGRIALSKLTQVNPDLVTLDIEMPELDGLGTLKEIRKTHPNLPVIMFSTLTERGAATTLDALSAGANDYVTKPANVGSVAMALARIKAELIPKIKGLCGRHETPEIEPVRAAPRMPAASAPATSGSATGGPAAIEIVAIGVSTGGPNALSTMLPLLPKNLAVPVVIVQHMPPIFTRLLAERLASECAIGMREGAVGMALGAGQGIIAPGGSHMVLARRGNIVCVETNMNPPENSCRPAVDVLFRSVAATFGPRVLGVILTGMGSDGLRGCEVIREAGGQVIVQDEASSVVWGMPGYVARAGLAQRVLPLKEIAGEIVRRVNQGNRSEARAAAAV
jgi:two-component system, chemotaxis family, protein-glutamate methylesterase/glutaminase